VLTVVYLIFDEGYTASSGDGLVREDLCTEAIRLERLLAELMPDEPEVTGLLALLARRWLASKWHANSPRIDIRSPSAVDPVTSQKITAPQPAQPAIARV
jgi:hypothetical protein